jgi:hypothetical protein
VKQDEKFEQRRCKDESWQSMREVKGLKDLELQIRLPRVRNTDDHHPVNELWLISLLS